MCRLLIDNIEWESKKKETKMNFSNEKLLNVTRQDEVQKNYKHDVLMITILNHNYNISYLQWII